MADELVDQPFLVIIKNLFTAEECEKLIGRANSLGWHAPNTGGHYDRALLIDPELAQKLWTEIQPICPPTYVVNGLVYKSMYLNDHFRFSRYQEGGDFPIHLDGNNVDSQNFRSMFTLNIFLNDDLQGGGTAFYHNDLSPRLTVQPKRGTGALFYAKQYHQGNAVEQGVKYLLRTDVMME